MKYVLLLIAIAAGVVLIMTLEEPVPSMIVPDTTPVAAVSLPPVQLAEDPAAAKRDLRQARRELAALQPKDPYIVINTHTNRLMLRTEDSILFEGDCSTGSGSELVDSLTGRHWVFTTPRGVFKVSSLIKDPWWRKPDWAFIEDNEDIPRDERERLDPNMMGDYAIGFGDGYFIHGTIYERLLGVNVTHGCVRLGTDDLKYVYNHVKNGTRIYIF